MGRKSSAKSQTRASGESGSGTPEPPKRGFSPLIAVAVVAIAAAAGLFVAMRPSAKLAAGRRSAGHGGRGRCGATGCGAAAAAREVRSAQAGAVAAASVRSDAGASARCRSRRLPVCSGASRNPRLRPVLLRLRAQRPSRQRRLLRRGTQRERRRHRVGAARRNLSVCLDVARDAMQMHASGASVKAIREANEKKWADVPGRSIRRRRGPSERARATV